MAVELYRNLKVERRDLYRADPALELARYSPYNATEVIELRGKRSLLQDEVCSHLRIIAAHAAEARSTFHQHTDMLSTGCLEHLIGFHAQQEATAIAVIAARSFLPELELRTPEWSDAARCQATYIGEGQNLSLARYKALNAKVLMRHISAAAWRTRQSQLWARSQLWRTIARRTAG